ncbi:MAG: Ig-like domain-containing protein, partial [Thermoplasmata archaeon]
MAAEVGNARILLGSGILGLLVIVVVSGLLIMPDNAGLLQKKGIAFATGEGSRAPHTEEIWFGVKNNTLYERIVPNGENITLALVVGNENMTGQVTLVMISLPSAYNNNPIDFSIPTNWSRSLTPYPPLKWEQAAGSPITRTSSPDDRTFVFRTTACPSPGSPQVHNFTIETSDGVDHNIYDLPVLSLDKGDIGIDVREPDGNLSIYRNLAMVMTSTDLTIHNSTKDDQYSPGLMFYNYSTTGGDFEDSLGGPGTQKAYTLTIKEKKLPAKYSPCFWTGIWEKDIINTHLVIMHKLNVDVSLPDMPYIIDDDRLLEFYVNVTDENKTAVTGLHESNFSLNINGKVPAAGDFSVEEISPGIYSIRYQMQDMAPGQLNISVNVSKMFENNWTFYDSGQNNSGYVEQLNVNISNLNPANVDDDGILNLTLKILNKTSGFYGLNASHFKILINETYCEIMNFSVEVSDPPVFYYLIIQLNNAPAGMAQNITVNVTDPNTGVWDNTTFAGVLNIYEFEVDLISPNSTVDIDNNETFRVRVQVRNGTEPVIGLGKTQFSPSLNNVSIPLSNFTLSEPQEGTYIITFTNLSSGWNMTGIDFDLSCIALFNGTPLYANVSAKDILNIWGLEVVYNSPRPQAVAYGQEVVLSATVRQYDRNGNRYDELTEDNVSALTAAIEPVATSYQMTWDGEKWNLVFVPNSSYGTGLAGVELNASFISPETGNMVYVPLFVPDALEIHNFSTETDWNGSKYNMTYGQEKMLFSLRFKDNGNSINLSNLTVTPWIPGLVNGTDYFFEVRPGQGIGSPYDIACYINFTDNCLVGNYTMQLNFSYTVENGTLQAWSQYAHIVWLHNFTLLSLNGTVIDILDESGWYTLYLQLTDGDNPFSGAALNFNISPNIDGVNAQDAGNGIYMLSMNMTGITGNYTITANATFGSVYSPDITVNLRSHRAVITAVPSAVRMNAGTSANITLNLTDTSGIIDRRGHGRGPGGTEFGISSFRLLGVSGMTYEVLYSPATDNLTVNFTVPYGTPVGYYTVEIDFYWNLTSNLTFTRTFTDMVYIGNVSAQIVSSSYTGLGETGFSTVISVLVMAENNTTSMPHPVQPDGINLSFSGSLAYLLDAGSFDGTYTNFTFTLTDNVTGAFDAYLTAEYDGIAVSLIYPAYFQFFRIDSIVFVSGSNVLEQIELVAGLPADVSIEALFGNNIVPVNTTVSVLSDLGNVPSSLVMTLGQTPVFSLNNTTAGTYFINASILNGQFFRNLTVVVRPAEPYSLRLEYSDGTSVPEELILTAGNDVSFFAKVFDIFGNENSTAQVRWSGTNLTVVGRNATFSPTIAADYRIVASVNEGAVSKGVNITVLPGAAAGFASLPDTLNLIAGEPLVLNLSLKDQYGNTFSDIANITFRLNNETSAMPSNFTTAGTYTLTVIYADGIFEQNISINVTPAAAVSIDIVFPQGTSHEIYEETVLTVVGYDAFGNHFEIPLGDVQWETSGNITVENGILNHTGFGDATLTARYGSLEKTISFTTVLGSNFTIAVVPSQISFLSNETYNLTAVNVFVNTSRGFSMQISPVVWVVEAGNLTVNGDILSASTPGNGLLNSTYNGQLFRLSVEVLPANRKPIVVSTPSSQILDKKDKNITLNLSSIFSDPDGDTLTFTVTAANGTVSINLTGGVVVILPKENIKGNDTITITADDGKGGTESVSFTVSVDTTSAATTDGGRSLCWLWILLAVIILVAAAIVGFIFYRKKTAGTEEEKDKITVVEGEGKAPPEEGEGKAGEEEAGKEGKEENEAEAPPADETPSDEEPRTLQDEEPKPEDKQPEEPEKKPEEAEPAPPEPAPETEPAPPAPGDEPEEMNKEVKPSEASDTTTETPRESRDASGSEAESPPLTAQDGEEDLPVAKPVGVVSEAEIPAGGTETKGDNPGHNPGSGSGQIQQTDTILKPKAVRQEGATSPLGSLGAEAELAELDNHDSEDFRFAALRDKHNTLQKKFQALEVAASVAPSFDKDMLESAKEDLNAGRSHLKDKKYDDAKKSIDAAEDKIKKLEFMLTASSALKPEPAKETAKETEPASPSGERLNGEKMSQKQKEEWAKKLEERLAKT